MPRACEDKALCYVFGRKEVNAEIFWVCRSMRRYESDLIGIGYMLGVSKTGGLLGGYNAYSFDFFWWGISV